MGFFEFLKNNLGHVFPVLLAGAFAMVIVAERIRALYFHYPVADVQAFFDKLGAFLNSGKTSEAVAFCDQHLDKPMVKVVKSAVQRAHLPEELITHGIEISVNEATQQVQKRTSFLAMIANVATLMGLFGTIVGLIQSFEAVAHADAQQKSALLAQGISTAMNATMLGLGVAIPCMVAFSFLMNRSNRMVAEIEGAGIRTLDLLKQRFYHADASADQERAA